MNAPSLTRPDEDHTSGTSPGSQPSPLSRVNPDSVAEAITKVGWVAKGLLFAVIGGLAFELGRRGPASADADQRGALERIAAAPAGRIVVFTVAVGLLLFAFWQFWSAVRREEDGWLGAAKRLGWAGLGVTYTMLGATGLQMALSGRRAPTGQGDGGPTSPRGITDLLFEVPGGRLLVVAIGAVAIGVGVYHLRKGLSRKFLEDINTSELSSRARTSLAVLGVTGFAARSLLLGVAGWLFIAAAWKYNPDEAAGIDRSLRTLTDAPFGRVLLMAVSVGLVAAGVYDIATFRRQELTEGEASAMTEV